MASIHKDLYVATPPTDLWDRVKDVGNISQLFPNFIPESEMGEDDSRSCTLADGSELRERIITVDDEHRRVAYTIAQAPMPLEHHHASMQVLAEGAGSRFVWVTDLKPDSIASAMSETLDGAMTDLANTLGAPPPE